MQGLEGAGRACWRNSYTGDKLATSATELPIQNDHWQFKTGGGVAYADSQKAL